MHGSDFTQHVLNTTLHHKHIHIECLFGCPLSFQRFKRMMRLVWGLNRCINVNMHIFVHFEGCWNRISFVNQFHFHGKFWMLYLLKKFKSYKLQFHKRYHFLIVNINTFAPYFPQNANASYLFSRLLAKMIQWIFMLTMCIYFYNYRCT